MAGDTTAEEIASRPRVARPSLWARWKTIVDRHVGKISLFKVLSGTVKSDDVLVNARTHSDERIHAPFTLRGKEQISVDTLPVGDIGAVAKLTDVVTGDTLAPKGTPVVVPLAAPQPEPALTVGIRPRSKGDDDKLMTALHRLQDEDPVLIVRRNDETHQTLLGGTGETHLAIVTERLARKFGVEVETEAVVAPYRETITGRPAEAEGQVQEADGRPRPVRRGQHQGGALRSGGRLRSSSTRSWAEPSRAQFIIPAVSERA